MGILFGVALSGQETISKLINACFSQITEFQKTVLESPNHKYIDVQKNI